MNFFLRVIDTSKKNLMFSISEDEISCFKINEIENDFIKDIHVIMKLF